MGWGQQGFMLGCFWGAESFRARRCVPPIIPPTLWTGHHSQVSSAHLAAGLWMPRSVKPLSPS